ncbi:agmatinase family protein [Geomicrobium sp. JCM 19055]|uniref:agmatinase family protein n=1 Tax=Geomicrobium sp. JCM 19055 TaxID=1460649 RepID=UPI00045EDB73|nr:agmatinase family protein [Geomicrobium sp. JCM 19055]GAK01369.1 arginase/agmatinase/formimionoglutamate hydrolase, arginase family [Geomicrobium sp. JCM 19055]
MSEYVYGNTPTFLGAKWAVDKDERGADVVIYGVPWEGGVTWGDYTGVELGPKSMRIASARYSGYLPELDHIDVFESLSLADMGDVDIIPAEVENTMHRISSFSKDVWNKKVFPVALGGDHSITYPIVKGWSESNPGKKLGIIHLDAHYDNMNDFNGDLYARNTPFARLYEMDAVVNSSLVHAGIHGPRNKPESGKFARDAGAITRTVNEFKETNDLRALARDLYKQASKDVDAVYLSICSDVLDHAYNPGGPVDTNGLTSYELLTVIHELGKQGLCGMDFVEVYPQQDPTDFSSHLASTVILYVLAGHAERI